LAERTTYMHLSINIPVLKVNKIYECSDHYSGWKRHKI